MLNLKGTHIYLRGLEPDDLDFLYELENNTNIWEISGTIAPYSKHVLKRYLENAHLDIYEVRQLRLCICLLEGETIGLIDLFEFDPQHKRIGLGVIISDMVHRGNGFGSEAVAMACDYAFSILNLHQVYANVLEDNQPSIALFEKLDFKRVGVKKDWIVKGEGYKNEVLYQKIRTS
ncbi:MAG: GNAT family N-acetyltransferase [Bacteroidota bacterium]